MVTSHLGRPTEGEWNAADSLAPVAQRLSELLARPVPLVRDWIDGGPWLDALAPGQVVLLENCRFNKGEKKDDDALARKMAELCDVYVNDAFGTAHRAEATTHGIARHAKLACAGPLMAAELDALGRALAQPARPLVAIVGGVEGIDQAHRAEGARGEGRRARRRRRHREHVHPRRAWPRRQVARRGRTSCPRRSRSSTPGPARCRSPSTSSARRNFRRRRPPR